MCFSGGKSHWPVVMVSLKIQAQGNEKEIICSNSYLTLQINVLRVNDFLLDFTNFQYSKKRAETFQIVLVFVEL